MTNVQPIQQPPIEDLRNALQITQFHSHERVNGSPAFDDIARLLRHAIMGLSEPNLAAMQAGAILLAEWQGTPEPQRQLRDTIQGILHAQLTGEIPQTWSEP